MTDSAPAGTSVRRRQWGSEKRAEPMPIVHVRPSAAKLTWGRIAITVTVLFWLAYLVSTIIRRFLDEDAGFRFTMEAVSYVMVVTVLTFSALMYLVARQGALRRFREHQRVPRGLLDEHFTEEHGALTVLIPSYAEEPDIVRLTMWSAALQEYPDLSVVLLVDDPPDPSDPDVRARLDATRALATEITDRLARPYAVARDAHDAAVTWLEDAGPHAPLDVVRALADTYLVSAEWLEEMARAEDVHDHVSEFFVDQVLMGLASDLRLTLLGLESLIEQEGLLASERVRQLHRRLLWIFGASASNFERKRFASLSHEANKAMNINAYLGLMGAVWRPTDSAEGTILVRQPDGAEAEPGDLDVRGPEYVLTLDADSQLLRDYCLRLVYFLEQPENGHVAITQTPYSSYRGAPTRIERIAGATTDIQHILHQGMTYYGATFWVGANAVIRRRALDDIVQVETIGGHEVRTYIQDRTVIEDTESSIDLAGHGWDLVNYPERLSYSATPPDFGSLVVQRRRWANGGLLILPKMWHQRRARRADNPVTLGEWALRVNYMASIAWASFSLLLLLFYPYDGRLLSPLVVGAALPYFIAMASDLKLCGHRYLDVFRIYGFNLVLLFVNLAGVFKSIQQAFTGEKIPFARTPKVRNRTASPAVHVLVPYLIVGYSLVTAWRSFEHDNWGNFAFALFNAVLAAMAISAYIGVRNSVVDMAMGLVNWLFVPRQEPAPAKPVTQEDRAVDWAGILYHGDRRLDRDLRRDDERRRRLTHR